MATNQSHDQQVGTDLPESETRETGTFAAYAADAVENDFCRPQYRESSHPLVEVEELCVEELHNLESQAQEAKAEIGRILKDLTARQHRLRRLGRIHGSQHLSNLASAIEAGVRQYEHLSQDGQIGHAYKGIKQFTIQYGTESEKGATGLPQAHWVIWVCVGNPKNCVGIIRTGENGIMTASSGGRSQPSARTGPGGSPVPRVGFHLQ